MRKYAHVFYSSLHSHFDPRAAFVGAHRVRRSCGLEPETHLESDSDGNPGANADTESDSGTDTHSGADADAGTDRGRHGYASPNLHFESNRERSFPGVR